MAGTPKTDDGSAQRTEIKRLVAEAMDEQFSASMDKWWAAEQSKRTTPPATDPPEGTPAGGAEGHKHSWQCFGGLFCDD